MSTCNPETFTRSTFHHFRKFTNTSKLTIVEELVEAYRDAVRLCVDYLWEQKIEYKSKKGEIKIWDRKNELLDCPSMISTINMGYSGHLSARVLKCASTQACGIVKALSKKRQKDKSKRDWLISINRQPGEGLINRINLGMVKPHCQKINCEINSICMDLKFEENGHFDGFLKLKSLWSSTLSNYPKGFSVKIPFKNYRRVNKWNKIGLVMNSIELNENVVSLRWKIPMPPKRITGKTVAIDQGMTTCLTVSDGQKSTVDKHGYDLSAILQKTARKKHGSKAFQRATEHRKNYINWAVNQLNLTDVKEIKLEKITQINYGRYVSKVVGHWVNTLIRDSLIKVCEEEGVLFTHTSNEFNSQRCYVCGWVHKSNRKGKLFKCLICGHEKDADFNASQNILIRDTLSVLPYGFREHRLNLKGFYWNSKGLFDVTGQELTVPVSKRINLN